MQAQQQHWLANVLISLTIIIYGISKNMACFAATLLCVVLLNFFKGINSLIYLFFICSFAHTSSDLHDELKIVRFLSGQAKVSLRDDARFPSDFCTNHDIDDSTAISMNTNHFLQYSLLFAGFVMKFKDVTIEIESYFFCAAAAAVFFRPLLVL